MTEECSKEQLRKKGTNTSWNLEDSDKMQTESFNIRLYFKNKYHKYGEYERTKEKKQHYP